VIADVIVWSLNNDRATTMSQDQDDKRFRRRVLAMKARARRRLLVDQLQLQAQVLCESHKSKQAEVAGRMLKVVLELLRNKGSGDALVRHMEGCAYHGVPFVRRDGNMLHIDGHFDIRDLSRRMVWEGVEQEKEIGDGL